MSEHLASLRAPAEAAAVRVEPKRQQPAHADASSCAPSEAGGSDGAAADGWTTIRRRDDRRRGAAEEGGGMGGGGALGVVEQAAARIQCERIRLQPSSMPPPPKMQSDVKPWGSTESLTADCQLMCVSRSALVWHLHA